MQVLALNRYPVKSMQGERPSAVELDERGVVGDRAHGVLDLGTGRILSAKWEPGLLQAHARQRDDDGALVLTLPTGETTVGLGARTDEVLSAWLGRPVSLRAAAADTEGTFQSHVDPLDDASEGEEWTGPVGSFRDSAPVHLLTTATLRAMAALAPDSQWDDRRFRANVVIDCDADGFIEDDWVGSSVRIGDTVLEVFKRTGRCSMVARDQPGGVVADPGVVRSLRAHRELKLGVHARLVAGKRLEVGMPVEPPRP